MLLLSLATFVRVRSLHEAGPDAAQAIMQNLIRVQAVLVAVGVFLAVLLATFLADSVASPLGRLQVAMQSVEQGHLEVLCPVVCNDEIGSLTEGFNRMVDGLRERESIRETFGKCSSATRSRRYSVRRWSTSATPIMRLPPLWQCNRVWRRGTSRGATMASCELQHGIDIHSGSVLAGNIGSTERMSYALVGDAVNVASRVESLNKEFGSRILVSSATRDRLRDTSALQPLTAVRVKGRSAEVQVFRVA